MLKYAKKIYVAFCKRDYAVVFGVNSHAATWPINGNILGEKNTLKITIFHSDKIIVLWFNFLGIVCLVVNWCVNGPNVFECLSYHHTFAGEWSNHLVVVRIISEQIQCHFLFHLLRSITGSDCDFVISI